MLYKLTLIVILIYICDNQQNARDVLCSYLNCNECIRQVYYYSNKSFIKLQLVEYYK